MLADVVLTILAVTALGFLGLVIQPPTPQWGVMLSDTRSSGQGVKRRRSEKPCDTDTDTDTDTDDK